MRVTTVDTDAAPYSGATGGSKTIYTMGPAVQRAAQEARERVLKIAAAEVAPASVDDLEMIGKKARRQRHAWQGQDAARHLSAERVVRRQATSR